MDGVPPSRLGDRQLVADSAERIASAPEPVRPRHENATAALRWEFGLRVGRRNVLTAVGERSQPTPDLDHGGGEVARADRELLPGERHDRNLVVLTRQVGDAAGGWFAVECGVAAVV